MEDLLLYGPSLREVDILNQIEKNTIQLVRNMLTDKLLVVMLKASKTGIDIHQLARELNISSNIVNDVLREYESRGLVTIHHDELSATPLQRLNLATLAINHGISIEQVAHNLEWQEFEDLAIRVLHHHSYSTKKHYRFKHHDRRFEIDIVGVKQPLILSIDCKHWKKSWQRSATLQMIGLSEEDRAVPLGLQSTGEVRFYYAYSPDKR